jgi:solute carrier organic anion transporter family, member 4A
MINEFRLVLNLKIVVRLCILLRLRIHRPISLSLGLMSICLGCILFFIPQFTTPANKPQGSIADGLCGSNVSSPVCEADRSTLSNYLVVFVVARVLIGMGATPILTLGVNFMDDCSPKEQFAKYCGTYAEYYSCMSV